MSLSPKSQVVCTHDSLSIVSIKQAQNDSTVSCSPSIKSKVCSGSLLHLVEVVGSPVVNIMTEASGHHGHALQVSEVTLQITGLSQTNRNTSQRERRRSEHSTKLWHTLFSLSFIYFSSCSKHTNTKLHIITFTVHSRKR